MALYKNVNGKRLKLSASEESAVLIEQAENAQFKAESLSIRQSENDDLDAKGVLLKARIGLSDEDLKVLGHLIKGVK